MEKVEWEDVQGLVLSGYQDLPSSAYILWRFLPGIRPATKHWLADLTRRIMRADTVDRPDSKVKLWKETEGAARPTTLGQKKSLRKQLRDEVNVWVVNLAMTASGLTNLGVEEEELCRFSSEYVEGMAPKRSPEHPIPRRTSVLGDLGINSPAHWQWGGWNDNHAIDGVLLLYANSKASLSSLIEFEIAAMGAVAEPIRRTSAANDPPLILEGYIDEDRKEHFGFRDGISQPIIKGTRLANTLDRKEARISLVNAGEFVLGYRNERGARVSFASTKRLPVGRSRDLARNGTYLVFRQLEQDVQGFRDFVAMTAKSFSGTFSTAAATEDWVASLLIGRTREGEPLIPPAADSTQEAGERNDFLYHFEDRFGLACPIGAHIRRANPRDTIGPDPDTALRLSKMHRIIRRGRPYGPRFKAGTNGERDEPRGMYFVALNADIAGQFELIQRSWINNRHFAGLYNETDPLSHVREDACGMTIQSRPANQRLDRLPQFVTMRGGAYFFMPGIKALQALAG